MTRKGKQYQYDPEVFKEKNEEHEFPKGAKGILVCTICGALYFKKSWNHQISIEGEKEEAVLIRKTMCPACRMIENKEFEGELIVSNIPKKHFDEVVKIIEDTGVKAYQRDTQHRLIGIQTDNNSLRATTTENQLAVEMSRKIKDAFKGKVEEKISYSPDPSDAVYIKIVFSD